MNAKQAALLMLHEVVMLNGDPDLSGTVRNFDFFSEPVRIQIDWKKGGLHWHRLSEMTFVEKWQPAEQEATK